MALFYQRVCLLVGPLLLVLSCLFVPTTSHAIVSQKQPGSRPFTTRYYKYQHPSHQRNNGTGQYVAGLHAYVAGESNKPGFRESPSRGPSYGYGTQGYPQNNPQEKYIQNPSHKTTQSQRQTATHHRRHYQFQPAAQQGSTKYVRLSNQHNPGPSTNQHGSQGYHQPNNHGAGSHTHGGPSFNVRQLLNFSQGNIHIPNINGAGFTIHVPHGQETFGKIYFPNEQRKNVHVHLGRVTHGDGSGHLDLPNEQRSGGHTHGPDGSHGPEFDHSFDTIQTEHGHIHVPKTPGNKPNLSVLTPELRDLLNPTSQHTTNNQEGILPPQHMTSDGQENFNTSHITNNSHDNRKPTPTSDTGPETLILPAQTTDQGPISPTAIGDEALVALLLGDHSPNSNAGNVPVETPGEETIAGTLLNDNTNLSGQDTGQGGQVGGTSVKSGDEQVTRGDGLLGIVNLRTAG